MPDRNVDGTPMVMGVDLNGRPYGRSAAWEDDPWHVEPGDACGSSPCGLPSRSGHHLVGNWSRQPQTTGARPMNRARHAIATSVPEISTFPSSAWLRLARRAGRAPARRPWLGQLPFQCLAKRHKVGVERDAQIAQFDHIQASHAALDIAHEVLHDTKLRGEVFLSNPLTMAQLAQQLAQALVFDPMDGFAHGRCRWERSWTLYCRIVFTNLVYFACAMLGVPAGSCAGEAGNCRMTSAMGPGIFGPDDTCCREGSNACAHPGGDSAPFAP